MVSVGRESAKSYYKSHYSEHVGVGEAPAHPKLNEEESARSLTEFIS